MGSGTKTALKIALLSQILAVCVHLYLTTSHYENKFGLSDGKSLCNISYYFNCDVANASIYSTLAGSPLALWGVLTNLCLLVVLAIYWVSENKEFYRHFSLTLSFVTIVASVAMAFITVTKINSVCIFCLSAYVLSFVSFFAILKIPREAKSMGFGEFFGSLISARYIKVSIILLASIPALTFLINSMVMNAYAGGVDTAIASSISDWKSGTDVDLTKVQGLTKGADASKAKMVIVEFADFQCIHCKQAHSVLANFVRSRPDVTMVFQSFPLDGLCNPIITRQGDGKSCDLAKAVYCGWKQGKGWELHDWAFENFGTADLTGLTSYAQTIGINIDEFRACRDLPETTQAIIEQAKLGEKVGVKGTPAVFVNGRILPGGQVMMILEAAYKELHK